MHDESENQLEKRLLESIRIAENLQDFPPRFVAISKAQEKSLRGWGMDFVDCIDSCISGYKAWLRAWPTSAAIPLWEDCSGARVSVICCNVRHAMICL